MLSLSGRGQSSDNEPPCETELRETQAALVDVQSENDELYRQIGDSTEYAAHFRAVTVPDWIEKAEAAAYKKGRSLGRREGVPIGSGALAGLAIGAKFGPIWALVGTVAGAAGGGIVGTILRKKRVRVQPTFR